MKKGNGIRRILAVMLAVVMIFGTSLTSLADAGVDVVEEVTTAAEEVTEAVAEILEDVEEKTTAASTEKATETTTVAATEASTNTSTESTTEQSTKDSTETTTAAGTEASTTEVTTETSTGNTETTEECTEAQITTEVEMVELTQTVDGTTITLSGPSSSFEPGKTYSIQVTKIENDANIEAALDEAAEKEDKVVESYQAFDIILLADGVEVQPLGPVSVRFSGNEVAEAIANEETETKVLHVDDAGQTADMEATTEGEDVAVETTHFSIYVVVGLTAIGGEINVTLEHWATVKTINGNGTDPTKISPHDEYKWITEDTVYNREEEEINWIEQNTQIYTTDSLVLPNGLSKNIEELSKICLASANKTVENKNYSIKEVWITDNQNNLGKEIWNPETYTIYNISSNAEVKLTKDTIIRIIYEEKNVSDTYWQDVEFYDHNVSNGDSWQGADEGTNSNANFSGSGSIKIGSGQPVSGNKSEWAQTASLNGRFLNKNGNVDPDPTENNKSGFWINTSIVKDKLDDNYKLQFNDSLKQPGFFEQGKKGTYYSNNYKLGFMQTGDTYILSKVINTSSRNYTRTNLETILQNDNHSHCFSNEFWPLDDLDYPGMDSRGNASDDGSTNHNWHFGMHYEFTFTIGDYTGPLNYYFRGDDDFWLFVDGKKVVDLGGIHSSIGHAVDLRAWMKSEGMLDDLSQRHRVTVYYMERGGFGSCCYMQFTLPNCKSVDVPEVERTTLTANKVWHADANKIPTSIQVELVRTISGVDSVLETQTLSAGNNWTYTWTGLPLHDVDNSNVKYTYSVREKNVPDGFISSVTSSGAKNTGFNYTITNIELIDIDVEKVWDDYQYNNVRPTSIEVKLMDGDNQVRETLTLNDANGWGKTGTVGWSDLPRYRLDANGNATIITYKVVETNVSDKYTTTYSPAELSTDGKVTITNTLKVHSLKLLKYSALNENTFLKGAKFKLVSKEGYFADRENSTDNNGVIKFKALPIGKYTLQETEAPEGYFLADTVYNIEVTDTGIKVNGEEITDKAQEYGVIYYKLGVSNSPLYELPSTGGSGIYWFMIAGLVLMMAAAYIIYRGRCKMLIRR